MIESPNLSRWTETHSWLVFAIGLALIVLLQQVAWKITGNPMTRFGQPVAMLVIGALSYLEIGRAERLSRLARLLLYAVAFVIVARVVIEIPIIFDRGPREWDFFAFYFDARVAAAGLNMYDPANYLTIASELDRTFSPGFHEQLISVGFKYPPPTALLLLPMGKLDPVAANIAWISGTVVALGSLCILLSILFGERSDAAWFSLGRLDMLAVASIFALSLPFRGTGLAHGQTTAMFACLAVLTIIGSGRRMSGVTACFSMIVKPFALLPSLILLIGRHWNAVIGGVITGVILLAASMLVLGTDDWAAYLSLEFATSAPPSLYNEIGNKSLLAVLVRAFRFEGIPWGNFPIIATYAALSTAVIVPSFWLGWKIARQDFRTAYVLLLLMALVVYPGTLYTYTIILSIPLTIEFLNQVREGRGIRMTILFLALAGGLLHWNLFAANLFLWSIFVWRSVQVMARNNGRS